MKKYFEAPYIKVVQVKNDVIATSVYNEEGDGTQLIQGRRGMWDDGFSEEDIY